MSLIPSYKVRCGPRRILAAVGLAMLAVWGVVVQPVTAQTDVNDEIVYLDPTGTIRVVDPTPRSEDVEVTWFSPTSGWVDFAVADVTNDGDDEIIAVRPLGAGGQLTIFDPVAIGADDDDVQFLDGIPWAILFELVLETTPRLVATGEFDLSRTGPEIIFERLLLPEERNDFGDSRRFTILRQPQDQTRGEAWDTQTTWDTGNVWTRVDAGNFDNLGIDEVVLVDEEIGNLSIYQVGDGFERFYRNSNESNAWRVARFGQFGAGGGEELGAVRTADFPLASAWVFRWDDDEVLDRYAERLIPSPRYMFWADINGNGDDEMAMLRSVPQELGQRPRLFIRDNGNETIILNDQQLDVDNGYLAGTGADTDGDGRDEVVIMRNNRIRVYTEPERATTSEEFDVETDSEHILAGNLDAAGIARESRLGVSQSVITATLRAGQTADVVNVAVTDVTRGSTIQFSTSIDGADEWVAVDVLGSSTPSTLAVVLDAVGLQPGAYRGQIVLTPSGSGVSSEPAVIDLQMQVNSGVTISPAGLLVEYNPCEEPLGIRTLPVSLSGPEGTAYRTAIEGSPGWVSVVPSSGSLPETITLTIDPAQRPADLATATLVVTVDLSNAPGTQELREVALVCAHDRKTLPFLASP